MIRAGFHVADITPPVGASIPGGFAPRPAEGIHDPLRVRAAALLGEDAALAVVGVDAVSISHDDNLRARKSAAPRLSYRRHHHRRQSHLGGPAFPCWASGVTYYREQIVRQIASAVASHAPRFPPAGLGARLRRGLAWNRRWVWPMAPRDPRGLPARMSSAAPAPVIRTTAAGRA